MYGNKEQFLVKFNPSLQGYAATNTEQNIMRKDIPTLAIISQGYGFGTSRSWLIAQLNDLNEFVGAKRKMNDVQIASTADILLQKFYHLKVTEFLLFFNNIKCGEYEMFYGDVDPQKIISSMYQFIKYRNAVISKYENLQNQEKYKSYKENGISKEEWEELKESWTMWADFMLPKYWSDYD